MRREVLNITKTQMNQIDVLVENGVVTSFHDALVQGIVLLLERYQDELLRIAEKSRES